MNRRGVHPSWAALVAAVAACGMPATAVAQTGTIAPGRIEQDTRRPPDPLPTAPIVIERPRYPEQVPEGSSAVSFRLGAVELTGNTALSTAALAPIWSARLGGSVSLAEAFGIAAAITARYREAGYVLSQAVVPAQQLDTAAPVTLRIEVVEGYIDRVVFSGAAGERLRPFLAASASERPLRLSTLERELLIVNELAGVAAQANLRAGGERGASTLEIVVARQKRAYSLGVHNRSTPAQGRVRFEGSADYLDVFGAFDRHDIRVVTSGDEKLKFLAYLVEAPIGSSGLKANVAASVSRSKPTSGIGNIDTRSDNLSIGLGWPVLRTRRTGLALRASFGGYDNRFETSSIVVSKDHIRALRVGATADYADDFLGVNLVDIEFAKGVRAFGASRADDPLLLGASPSFSKTTMYLARLQGLGGNWSVLFAGTAQFSNDKLPTAEQLGLGGDTFLRAYDPSEVIGENGLAGKVELRYAANFQSFASTAYGYFDSGNLRRRQLDAPDQHESLSATGIGVRFTAPYRLRGYIEIAKPIHRAVASRGNLNFRVFSGLGIDF